MSSSSFSRPFTYSMLLGCLFFFIPYTHAETLPAGAAFAKYAAPLLLRDDLLVVIAQDTSTVDDPFLSASTFDPASYPPGSPIDVSLYPALYVMTKLRLSTLSVASGRSLRGRTVNQVIKMLTPAALMTSSGTPPVGTISRDPDFLQRFPFSRDERRYLLFLDSGISRIPEISSDDRVLEQSLAALVLENVLTPENFFVMLDSRAAFPLGEARIDTEFVLAPEFEGDMNTILGTILPLLLERTRSDDPTPLSDEELAQFGLVTGPGQLLAEELNRIVFEGASPEAAAGVETTEEVDPLCEAVMEEIPDDADIVQPCAVCWE